MPPYYIMVCELNSYSYSFIQNFENSFFIVCYDLNKIKVKSKQKFFHIMQTKIFHSNVFVKLTNSPFKAYDFQWEQKVFIFNTFM